MSRRSHCWAAGFTGRLAASAAQKRTASPGVALSVTVAVPIVVATLRWWPPAAVGGASRAEGRARTHSGGNGLPGAAADCEGWGRLGLGQGAVYGQVQCREATGDTKM